MKVKYQYSAMEIITTKNSIKISTGILSRPSKWRLFPHKCKSNIKSDTVVTKVKTN